MLSITTHDGLRTEVHVTSDPDSLTAGLGIVGHGEARCRPTDLFVRSTGDLIALGRAIQDFGRQVEAVGLEESVGVDEVERVLNAVTLATADAVAEALPTVIAMGPPAAEPVYSAEAERDSFLSRWLSEIGR